MENEKIRMDGAIVLFTFTIRRPPSRISKLTAVEHSTTVRFYVYQSMYIPLDPLEKS